MPLCSAYICVVKSEKIPNYGSCTLDDHSAENRQVLVSRFAPYLKKHHTLHLPHRHSFYHVLFFTKGSGSHTIDFEKFPVRAGEIYFMSPRQVHSWDFKNQPDGYVLNFDADFFHSFLHNTDYLQQFPFFNGRAADNVLFLSPTLQQRVNHLFVELLKAYSAHGPLATDLIRVLILQILLIITIERKLDTGRKPENSNPVMRRFLDLLEQQFTNMHLPNQYAEKLFVTANYLNALCKKTLGKSAGETIRGRLLLEAKRLLVNADLNISQVALQLNFTDPSHFSKFFKKATGQLPEDFKKHLVTPNK